MGYNLKDKLVVAISSRALFDLEEENKIFEDKGLDEYYKYQLENESKPLKKGTGYRLVENLLKINKFFDAEEKCWDAKNLASARIHTWPPDA